MIVALRVLLYCALWICSTAVEDSGEKPVVTLQKWQYCAGEGGKSPSSLITSGCYRVQSDCRVVCNDCYQRNC